MKVRYVGESFGVDGLTNNKEYECLGVINDEYVRVIDDSGEDYLYSAKNPAPLDKSSPGGKWIVTEDDRNKTLSKIIRS